MTFAPYLEHSTPIFRSPRVAIVVYKISCDMLPETSRCYYLAKLYSKNKDHHAHDTRGKNLLRIPAGTIFFYI